MQRAFLTWLMITVSLPLFGSGELSLTIGTEGLVRKQGLMVYNNELLSGYTYELYTNGNTKLKTHWVNGKRHGKQLSWFENGKIKEIRFYKNNRKDDQHQGWFGDGTPRFEYNFIDGQYHGSSKEWYPDGSIASEHNYEMGKESGTQKVYEANGQIRANYVVKDGYRYGLVGSKNCITSPTAQL